MKPPCDEGAVRSANAAVLCAPRTGRWILAATIFGSSMAFIDGTVVNVALPALQTSLHASVVSVQGVVAAFLVPGSLSLISASFDEKKRGQAIGTWSAFTAITTAMGPVLGGWLIEHASWRWVFFINVPLAAAVI